MSPLPHHLRRVAPLLLALVTGCGYSNGVRLPEGSDTVAVEYFGNDSPEPDLERELHSRLSQQVSRMVSAPLVNPSRADLLIQGHILDYRRLFGIIGIDNDLLESGVLVTIEAWLYDPRRGTLRGERIRLDREIRYMVWVRAEEAGAREIALDTLTQELVLDLFSQESYEPPEVDEEREESPLVRGLERRDDLH